MTPRGVWVGTLVVAMAVGSACTDSGTTVGLVSTAAASLTITVADDAPGQPVSGERVVLEVGDSLSLAVTATNALGLAVQSGAVTWSSSNASVADVSAAGLLRGVAPGTAGILASADGVTATLTAVVNDTVTAFPVSSR